MFAWLHSWVTSQYQDLVEEMHGYDERLIAAEKKLNELDHRLAQHEARLPRKQREATDGQEAHK